MAKWTDRPVISDPGALAGNDTVLMAQQSRAVGDRDVQVPNDTLRAFLGAGITVGVAQVAHGLTVGDVLRFDGTNYVLATADTAANAEAVGVVTSTPDLDSLTYQTAGMVGTLSGLTPGELYYLQDDGSLGTSAGTVDKPVLIATSATSAVLILAISGAGAGGAASWGELTGDISDQTDLQNALGAKLEAGDELTDLASTGATAGHVPKADGNGSISWAAESGGDTSGLLPKLATVNPYAGNRTLNNDDSGAYVRITAAGTVTLPDSLAAGFQCVIVNATAGDTVELAAATTLTLPAGFEPEIQNRRAVTVIHVGSNVWEAHGALVEEEA